MSAVFGRLNLSKKPIEHEQIATMLQSMNYWNADKKGVWHEKNVGLGNLLLFNTPESLQEQLPYFHAESGVSITADARIDNRVELCIQLGILESRKKAIPDSQLILEAYLKWGKACPKHLYGAFAFAIWDSRNQSLFCARDQIGVKSLFYHHSQTLFAFATELKGLLVVPEIPQDISKTYLLNILGNMNGKTEDCFYQAIKKLPPAHSLSIDSDGNLQFIKYWRLDTEKKIRFSSDWEYVEAYREKLIEAVHCRLKTAYPVGCQLSGGLDSSGIAAIGFPEAEKKSLEFRTYSNGMAPEGWGEHFPYRDDYEQIQAVLDYTGIRHNEKITSSHLPFLEEIAFAVNTRTHPEPTYLFHATNRIFARANQHHVRTMLSGFPGDELATAHCSGYLENYFTDFEWVKLWKSLKRLGHPPFRAFLSKAVAGLANQLPKNWQPISDYKTKKLNRTQLLSTDLWAKHLPYYQAQIPNFNRYNPLFTNQKLVNAITAPHVDKRMELESLAARHWRMESRYPLADVRLLEFTLATPTKQKAFMEHKRWLFRRAMEGLLPKNIQYQGDSIINVIPYETTHLLASFEPIKQYLEERLTDHRFDFLNLKETLESWKNIKNKKSMKHYSRICITMEILYLIETKAGIENNFKQMLT